MTEENVGPSMMLAGFGAFEERLFRFSGGGLACGDDGLSVGGVALLEPAPAGWRARESDAVNAELSERYGLPVDASTKAGGFAAVARALNKGDMALAKIAALLLQFPDPPPLTKKAPGRDDVLRRAGQLWASGLLKGDWNEENHPRTGKPPNRGWFAAKPESLSPTDTPNPRSEWPPPAINKRARDWVASVETAMKIGGEFALRTNLIAESIVEFVASISPLNEGEDRLTAQLKANFDPPKTLEELKNPPVENQLGYERHHIVEQNDANVEKIDAGSMLVLHKFGRDAIEDPSNVVWVPRLKHEKITSDYNSKVEGGPSGPRARDIVNRMEFDSQRAAGLAKLREYGVLQ
jgi:hypothetical protein